MPGRVTAGTSLQCPARAMASAVRALVSQQRIRFKEDGYDLDLTYITPQVIAMGVPGVGLEQAFRNPEDEVARFFRSRHAGRFMIYNLACEKLYDYSKFDDQVIALGWPDHHAPPLQVLFQLCQSLYSWLSADVQNVAAVHCKAGKGRTGTVIAAYLLYAGLASDPAVALSYFSSHRSADVRDQSDASQHAASKGGVTIPSQARYVHYLHRILSNQVQLQTHRVRLKTIIINGSMNCDGDGGWRPYIKIYVENEREIYSSRDTTNDVTVNTTELFRLDVPEPQPLLCGDYLIVFKHRRAFSPEDVFRFSFNTGFCDGMLRFSKRDLDDGYKDKRLSADFFIDLYFEKVELDGSEPDPFAWTESIQAHQVKIRAHAPVGGSLQLAAAAAATVASSSSSFFSSSISSTSVARPARDRSATEVVAPAPQIKRQFPFGKPKFTDNQVVVSDDLIPAMRRAASINTFVSSANVVAPLPPPPFSPPPPPRPQCK